MLGESGLGWDFPRTLFGPVRAHGFSAESSPVAAVHLATHSQPQLQLAAAGLSVIRPFLFKFTTPSSKRLILPIPRELLKSTLGCYQYDEKGSLAKSSSSGTGG